MVSLTRGELTKKLHLNARALHHVPEDERHVGPVVSHRDEYTGEGGRRVREVDREQQNWDECACVLKKSVLMTFGGGERLLDICHETLALTLDGGLLRDRLHI